MQYKYHMSVFGFFDTGIYESAAKAKGAISYRASYDQEYFGDDSQVYRLFHRYALRGNENYDSEKMLLNHRVKYHFLARVYWMMHLSKNVVFALDRWSFNRSNYFSVTCNELYVAVRLFKDKIKFSGKNRPSANRLDEFAIDFECTFPDDYDPNNGPFFANPGTTIEFCNSVERGLRNESV